LDVEDCLEGAHYARVASLKTSVDHP
jgi:hypothetical protein